MYTMLRDNHAIAVKTSLQVMIALYKVYSCFCFAKGGWGPGGGCATLQH